MNFDEKITENFTLREFVDSATAKELKISNIPDTEQIVNIKKLVKKILQPARDALGMPITVTSGFRSKELNKAVKGANKSLHLDGFAADITCADNKKLFEWIRNNCKYTELIYEGGDEKQPKWVHIGYNDEELWQRTLKYFSVSKNYIVI
jgi:uncharacterized protein YcbK (DUF882 family)